MSYLNSSTARMNTKNKPSQMYKFKNDEHRNKQHLKPLQHTKTSSFAMIY